jgi:hypothetical protein
MTQQDPGRNRKIGGTDQSAAAIDENLTAGKVGRVPLEVESDCAVEAAANLLMAV